MFLSVLTYVRNGDSMKKIVQFLLLLVLALLLFFGNTSISLSKQALTLWFENLVPSMFVTMVIIRLLYKQHMLQALFPTWFCQLFGLDQQAMALVISSMLLGFPNGSAFIEEAYQQDQITQASANRLFLICCFPTPAFVILSCGAQLYHAVKLGLFLYLSQLLYGFLCLFFTRRHKVASVLIQKKETSTFMKDLSSALLESGTSLFLIGGYLMLFMSITGILFSFLPEGLRFPLQICAEFSSGTFLIQQHFSYPLSLLLTCVLFGFGGFCVHLQIFSMCPTCKTSYGKFFLARLLQSILSVSIFCLLLHLFV